METPLKLVRGKTIREFSDRVAASGTLEDRLNLALLAVAHAETQLDNLEQAIGSLLNRIDELNAELSAYRETKGV